MILTALFCIFAIYQAVIYIRRSYSKQGDSNQNVAVLSRYTVNFYQCS